LLKEGFGKTEEWEGLTYSIPFGCSEPSSKEDGGKCKIIQDDSGGNVSVLGGDSI